MERRKRDQLQPRKKDVLNEYVELKKRKKAAPYLIKAEKEVRSTE